MNFEPMMAARVVKEVELGFVETPEDLQLLTSPHFPSKVGGKPAWLDHVHLPSPEDIACGSCQKPMTFLLQVYAPVPVDERDPEGAEYHRTLFVFMCRDASCHSVGACKSFKVLRCQLDEKNHAMVDSANCSNEDLSPAMSDLSLSIIETRDDGALGSDSNCVTGEHNQVTSEPSESRTTNSTSNDTQQNSSNSQSDISPPNLCIVCGCIGPHWCGRCTQAHYCSKEHQTHDWKAGHRRLCEDLASGKLTMDHLNYNPSSGVVLPGYEIVTELEPDLTSHGNGERSEEERMADYYKFMKSGKCGSGELSAKALKDAATSEHKMDKQFRTFKKRIAIEPEQVREKEGGVGGVSG